MVFIDFERSRGQSALGFVNPCEPLWHPVAPCGPLRQRVGAR
jgi:hypothetical protein